MALVVVLSIVTILGILTGLVGNSAGRAFGLNQRSNEQEKAHFVAQGGLSRALSLLRTDPNFTGVTNKPFPGDNDSTYTLEVIENNGGTPKPTRIGVDLPPGRSLVISEGTVSDTTRTMAGLVQTSVTPSSGFAMLAGQHLEVKGAKVGAFTAPEGDFSLAALEPSDGQAQIGATGAVAIINKPIKDDNGNVIGVLNSDVDGDIASDRVDGDLATVEESVYEIAPNSTVGGESVLDAPPEQEPVPTPDYLGGPDIDLTLNGSQTINPGHYSSLHLADDAVLTLEAGDYFVEGNIEMWDRAKLEVNGPVKIHCGGAVTVAGDPSMNFEADPRNLELTVTGTEAPGQKFPWLPWSKNLTVPEPYRPTGAIRRFSIGGRGTIFGRVRVNRAEAHVSGNLYGDIQADGLSVGGDADGSGTVQFFADLATVDTGNSIGVDSSQFYYEKTWVVR